LLRLVAVLLAALIPAGLGAIFLWSTLNLVMLGDASLARILLAALVLIGVLGLLYWAYRTVSGLEEPG
jgi:hypothetical protein